MRHAPIQSPPPYLSRSEICVRLGVSRSTTYRLQAEGFLPRPVRIGPGTVRWRRDELEAFEARLAADRGQP